MTDELSNEDYNEVSEKAELMRELADIESIVDEKLGNYSGLIALISDALTYGELDELRMAKAALESLPEHLKETLKTDWRPQLRRPEFKDVLEQIVFKGENQRFLKIQNIWNQDTEKEEIKGKIVFELLQTNSLVNVYVQEGTSREDALDFLKKAATELEDSWHLVSDSDQYQGYID